jgi:DNA-binding SARP family transcriptional activator
MLDDRWTAETTGASAAAVTICGACEDLLTRVGAPWPGGDANRALERLRARVEALLAQAPAEVRPPGAPPRLEVRSLGQTRLRAGGRVVDPPRRSRLVLQYLITHRDRPVGRDVLLEAFWPGSSPAAGRNSLNVAVTLLRRALRPVYGDHPVVVFRDEAYRLDPALDVWVDREEFEHLARQGAERHRSGDHAEAVTLLRAARDLYGGPLFADEPYEEWIVAARRALEAEHLAALTALGESLAALGARREGAEALREVLAAEPEREDVHRLLMELHTADGRAYLALRQFEACQEALRRRLGVEPGPETQAMRERILRRGPAPRTGNRAVIAA